MSPAALGQAIAAALGIAISPVSIVTVFLLLLSPRAKPASLGFLLGWSFGILAAVTAFTLLSGVVPMQVPGAAHTVLGTIQLVVGVLLLLLAAVQWQRRPRGEADRPRTPAWMRTIDRATLPIAFAGGFVMAVNPPNLLLSLAGGVAIGGSSLTGSEVALAIAVFLGVAASTVLIPVALHFVAAERLRRPLDAFRLWLTRHNSAILTVVFGVLGLLVVAQGISALSTG